MLLENIRWPYLEMDATVTIPRKYRQEQFIMKQLIKMYGYRIVLLMMNVQTVEQENKYNEVRGYELHIF